MLDSISVVTPTFYRPEEAVGLLSNLAGQTRLPFEVILVDGAPTAETATEIAVEGLREQLPFRCRYVRHGGGTAIQRNVGIDEAGGEFIAFIDDDMRLDPDFFEQMLAVFAQDPEGRVGGCAGCIRNQFVPAQQTLRWIWYRRLGLFSTYEPGRYDYRTGYPINRYLQAAHDSIREIDFMGTNCAVWRRAVFDAGLRFSPFFCDYGVLEDAHLALRAGRRWKLWEVGRARCEHRHSPRGRINKRRREWKTAVNYRFVFMDLVVRRTLEQESRFWGIQIFDLARLVLYAVRTGKREDWGGALGKLEGILAALRLSQRYVLSMRPGEAASRL